MQVLKVKMSYLKNIENISGNFGVTEYRGTLYIPAIDKTTKSCMYGYNTIQRHSFVFSI